MADKKAKDKKLNFEEMLSKTKFRHVRIEDEMQKSFISYAMAVNVSRAIPDVRDGLKPVHRRILYTMANNLGLFSDKPYRKSVKIVGEVLGNYHPHGDTAVYEAIVRMAQDFSMRYMLVDGQGNFGSVDGDGAAAMRYTEARLAKISNEMLRDIDKETVDFYPNFDETCMQPRVLPARFPALLVNGASGIAVGMATNIPPHNLGEVINGVIAQIKNPEIEIDELMKYVPAPDFPTGGILMGRKGIKDAYRTGKGSYVLRAKTEIEEFDGGTRQRIVATEIPYQVNKSNLIKHIAELTKSKKIEGIADLRDESDRDGMRIVIDVKRDANAQVVLNLLFKHTNMQISDGITLLALDKNEPKVMSLKEINSAYIAHQQEVVRRGIEYDLVRTEEKKHVVEGLVIALASIDEVIEVIKKSKDRQDALAGLMNNFILSEKQAQAVLDTRLVRLTSLEVETLKADLKVLEEKIAEFKAILQDAKRIDEIVIEDLTAIKAKYGDDRRTEISHEFGDIDIGDMIAEEEVVVSMTHMGYIKRISAAEYKAQRRGGKGVIAHKSKDEDYVESMFVTSSHADLLFFTDFGKVYCIKAFEIPEANRQSRGRAAVNLFQLDLEEKINAVIPIDDFNEGYLVMATKKGLIKKTLMSEFASIRKSGKIAITLEEGDSLVSVLKTTGKNELLIASKDGKCMRFAEEDVRAIGRVAKGVRSIELKEDDMVVDLLIVDDSAYVLAVTEKGYGKRTPLSDYRLQKRGGKGVKAAVLNEKTGKLVGLKIIEPGQEVLLLTVDGTMIRTRGDEISTMSRDTVGVHIMRVNEGDSISSIAVLDAEEENEEVETSNETLAEETSEVVETAEIVENATEDNN